MKKERLSCHTKGVFDCLCSGTKIESKRKQQYHHSTVCRVQELFVVFADMGHRSKVMVKTNKKETFLITKATTRAAPTDYTHLSVILCDPKKNILKESRKYVCSKQNNRGQQVRL